MDWANYYDRVFDWSESARVRRLSDQTDIGPSDELFDAAQAFDEDKNASKRKLSFMEGTYPMPQKLMQNCALISG